MYKDVLYADFASLQGRNLLEQRRSSCRGAKIGYVQGCIVCRFCIVTGM